MTPSVLPHSAGAMDGGKHTPVTADEMKESITVMLLNRIDELQDAMDAADLATPANVQSETWLKLLNRKHEAEYIIATCLDRFVPRRAALAAAES